MQGKKEAEGKEKKDVEKDRNEVEPEGEEKVEKKRKKKMAQGQNWSAIPFALLHTFWESKMYTAGQMELATNTGPGPSFF